VATENQQHDKNATPSLSGRGAARRRLTRAGAGALLTLGSRGALASVPTCLTPSGFWSSGLNPANSHYGHETCAGGRSPGYWKQAKHQWPGGLDPAKTPFTFAFPMVGGAACPAPAKNASGTTTAPPAPTSYECALLLDMLSHQGFDKNNLGMHMAAAFLNASAGLTPFLTVADLRQIWNEVSQPGGIYHPTAGVDWTRADVVKYLQATMT